MAAWHAGRCIAKAFGQTRGPGARGVFTYMLCLYIVYHVYHPSPYLHAIVGFFKRAIACIRLPSSHAATLAYPRLASVASISASSHSLAPRRLISPSSSSIVPRVVLLKLYFSYFIDTRFSADRQTSTRDCLPHGVGSSQNSELNRSHAPTVRTTGIKRKNGTCTQHTCAYNCAVPVRP